MPKQTVIAIRHPMPLVREVQEATRHTETLQHVERLQRLGDDDAVVEVVADDEFGGAEVFGVDEGIPPARTLVIVPLVHHM